MKDIIFLSLPIWFQNLIITIYNSYLYKVRHSGLYKDNFYYYSNLPNLQVSEISILQNKKLSDFLYFAKNNSSYYEDIDLSKKLSDIPLLTKSDLINHFDEISTISPKNGIVSLTGGTTGASLKVVYTKADMQERFALLDSFRSSYGYKLGMKTAWFSGKKILGDSDLSHGICHRDDWFNKIRFYSTFHITEENFDIYWASLNSFLPEFLVGFPSSVFDICNMAKSRGLKFRGSVKYFFTTAETVLPIHREVISDVLGCCLIDQYASSEGAPFIFECRFGSMHMHPLTGIFEVVNEDLSPTESGELLVTSFTTHGTPLIRYRISDHVTMSPPDFKCRCGTNFPTVSAIEGRTSDFILSPTNGRVNLGNISNATKGVSGLVKFQLIQESLNKVIVKLVTNEIFTKNDEKIFVESLKYRLGSEITLDIRHVSSIDKEKSGKYRLVINLINRN